ncbi:MAG: PTS sugar transporter subunit IIA [Sebaldella sp.]|nr:PTS sugar transporter subunit IIA [Sebaldella sp.]
MKQELLKKECIKLNVNAKNWEDAISIAGNLLVNNNFIKKEYITAIIEMVKELGPYIVITDGVAIPHARPEDGVIKLGYSLITLDPPINFGNPDNDPVKLIVCIAAIDNNSHIDLITKLVNLINNDKLAEIINAKAIETVLKIFNED